MKFEDLNSNLDKGLKPCYLVYGGDSALFSKTLEQIESKCNIQYKDLNKIIFSDDNYNLHDVVESCQVLPFIDSMRLIIVKNHVDKKNESERGVLKQYLKNPVLSTCLVLVDDGVSNFNLYLNNIEKIECSNLSKEYLYKLINKLFAEENKTISKENADILIEFCNYNFTRIESEIKKLVSFVDKKNEISREDIEKIVTKDEEYIIFELTDALSKKDGSKAISIVTWLFDNKEMPTSILSVLINNYRRVFFVATSKYSDEELSKLLNVKPYAIVKSRQQARLYTPMKLKSIYEKCLNVEYMIKSGSMEPKNAVYFLINQILLV